MWNKVILFFLKFLENKLFFLFKKFNFYFYFPGSSFSIYNSKCLTDITLGFWGVLGRIKFSLFKKLWIFIFRVLDFRFTDVNSFTAVFLDGSIFQYSKSLIVLLIFNLHILMLTRFLQGFWIVQFFTIQTS
jgi:hypothetical protein